MSFINLRSKRCENFPYNMEQYASSLDIQLIAFVFLQLQCKL